MWEYNARHNYYLSLNPIMSGDQYVIPYDAYYSPYSYARPCDRPCFRPDLCRDRDCQCYLYPPQPGGCCPPPCEKPWCPPKPCDDRKIEIRIELDDGRVVKKCKTRSCKKYVVDCDCHKRHHHRQDDCGCRKSHHHERRSSGCGCSKPQFRGCQNC